MDCKEQRHANLRSEFFWISSWQRTWIYLTLHVCYNFHFCLFSWQMCGLVGWLCMLCWWEHIHSRTRRTQRISGKQSMYYILSCVCLSSIQVLFFLFTVYEFLVVYLQRIMAVQYKIPDYVHISQDCRHLLSRIFVANPIRVWMNKPCLNLTINLYCEDTSYYIALVDVLSLNFNQSGN